VIKCAQALGPFKNPINRLAAKLFLPRMKLIVARGDYTAQNLSELKLNNVVEGADYAFSLTTTPQQSKAADTYLKHPVFNSKKKVVGVAPSSVIKKRLEKQGLDYQQIMHDFVQGLLDRNYAVAILPHSMSDYKQKPSFVVRLLTGKSHNDDMSICKDLFAEFKNQPDIMLLDKEIGAQPLRKLIGACDIFVASRFHAMVAALSMEVPVMVIGWSHKYAEVLKMFDCEELAFDFKNTSAQQMLKNFEQIAKQQATIKTKITKHLPAVTQLSKKHAAFVGQVVDR
jgi:polysaccharide pyruvyl transferase WcaK-like protein